jgi:hypothetical protein
MSLIITPFLVLLLWDDVENLIENFQSKKKAAKQGINLTTTQEPLYVEDVNRPTYNMHPFIRQQEDGESSPRMFPYSVVNGGVHSVQELRSAIRRDPVVAKHYSNFKLDRARVVEAKADRNFHVSYRIGDEIFWTKKRLKVAKGERLITDGANFTRTRCANVLSEVPQGKTSLDEPTPEVLDTPTLPASDPTPFIPPVIIAGDPLDPGAPMLPPWDPTPFIPPVVIPGGPLGPGAPTLPPWAPTPFIPPGPGPGPNPVPVPEPTTLLLLGSGLAGLWGFRKKLKK